jgi:hypothetical protein
MAGNKWERVMLKFSPSRQILGISCSAWLLLSKEQKTLCFKKLEDALVLIKNYSPVRFSDLSSKVKNILVAGDPTFHGQYVRDMRLIEIYYEYALATETTTQELASTLIHEAQHARLFDLGIEYDEGNRDRVERICFQAEKNFGIRIPEGESVIKKADAWLEASTEEHFSSATQKEADYAALKQLGCPSWIVSLVRRCAKRKAN